MKTVENETLLFRFYDPRVLPIIAPIFDPDQANELLENIITMALPKGDEVSRCFISPSDRKIAFKNISITKTSY